MKRFLVLASLLILPLSAFGDFVPGRVRTSAEAELSRIEGDGLYHSVSRAHAIQLQTDGKGVTGFHLWLDHGLEISFAVREVEPSPCGRIFRAISKEGKSESTLTIEEFSPEKCREDGKLVWKGSLFTKEDGSSSRLMLEGNPHYFVLTQ